ncbi:hypothetical protein DIS13_09330 [Weissella paramesenteroides]|uniref:hypothetical protein n=1 Tax=Weissella paramesenteroides TaxID=1249 RepID=UPI00116F446C|nr:hypothetical protein [Weissella paramesenteroides]TOY71533.1 hypothetical protein DIS13_09330 [Weissella paramesenteroides]
MQESTFVKMVKGGAIVAIAGVVVTIGGFKTFEKVDNGNVGIEYSMNGGVRDKAIGQGECKLIPETTFKRAYNE